MIGRRAGLVVVLPWVACAGSIPAGAFRPLCGLLRGALVVPGQLHMGFWLPGLYGAIWGLVWPSWRRPVRRSALPGLVRYGFGLEFGRLRRFASSMGIWSTSAQKWLCGPCARLYGYFWRAVCSWLASWCLARFLALFGWSVPGVGRVFGFLRRFRRGVVLLCGYVPKMPLRGCLGPYLAVYGLQSSSALQVLCFGSGLASLGGLIGSASGSLRRFGFGGLCRRYGVGLGS